MCDTALRAVTALLRRAAVRRLLVVLGVLAAGWLAGSAAAQAAHADGPPPRERSAEGARVLDAAAQAPVVADALRTVRSVTADAARSPVRLPLGDGLPEPAPLRTPVLQYELRYEPRPVWQWDSPPAAPVAAPSVRRDAPPAGARVADAARTEAGGVPVRVGPRRHGPAATPRATSAAGVRHDTARTPARTAARTGDTKRPAAPGAPIPAPVQSGTSAPGTTLIPLGGLGGPLAREFAAHPRTRGVLAHAPGVLPPVVRTAADEPSFAPD